MTIRHGQTFALLLTTAAFAASSAPASASQGLCIPDAGSVVTTPGADGTCKKGTLKTLVEQSELDAAKQRIATLESKVSALESDTSALKTKLSKVSYDPTGLNGLPTLTIDGANLQIVSGSGSTDGATNGLGNVFIGYDERLGDTQTGSHNLVIGASHTFTSFGGLVAGNNNTIGGSYSSVTAGNGNAATGNFASVSGGQNNTASGIFASVSGGDSNAANGNYSSILGGFAITVDSDDATYPAGP